MSKRTNPDFANYYVRDAQGNALATYSLKKDSLYLIEHNLYGSSRLGVKNLAILAQIDTQRQQISDTLRIFEERVGAKNYELSNHLGNVLATISDKTIFNYGYYSSIVYSAQLYYPFGWEIPTLSYTAKKYRFGFNGKEDDREWYAQDYGFRLYTPREGRFISVDPIAAQYPELTPYQFASNTPIQAVDLDGLEASFLEKGGSGSVDFRGVIAVPYRPYRPSNYYRPPSTKKGANSPVIQRNPKPDGGFDSKFFGIRNPFEPANAIMQQAIIAGFNNNKTVVDNDELDERKGFEGASGTNTQYNPKNIALGLSITPINTLSQFAKTVNAQTWENFTSLEATGDILAGQIEAAIKNSNNQIHFNLTSMQLGTALMKGKKGPIDNNVTNWELYTVFNTPGALSRTTFYMATEKTWQTGGKLQEYQKLPLKNVKMLLNND